MFVTSFCFFGRVFCVCSGDAEVGATWIFTLLSYRVHALSQSFKNGVAGEGSSDCPRVHQSSALGKMSWQHSRSRQVPFAGIVSSYSSLGAEA